MVKKLKKKLSHGEGQVAEGVVGVLGSDALRVARKVTSGGDSFARGKRRNLTGY